MNTRKRGDWLDIEDGGWVVQNPRLISEVVTEFEQGL